MSGTDASTVGAKPRLGISTCLLGEKVRYDGAGKRDPFLVDTFGQFVEWVPVCPEVECGLPVPREAMHLDWRSRFATPRDPQHAHRPHGPHEEVGAAAAARTRGREPGGVRLQVEVAEFGHGAGEGLQ